MYKITEANILLNANLILSKAGMAEGMRVADLGCGSSGRFVFLFADIVGKKGMVYAVDIIKNTLEIISRRIRQENISNIKPVWSDLEIFKATKIESNSLNIAFLINTLCQSRKQKEILREAVRIIKKGGKLIIIEWKKTTIPFGPPIEKRVDKKMLINFAPKIGLELEEDFFVGHYHYGLIFKKLF